MSENGRVGGTLAKHVNIKMGVMQVHRQKISSAEPSNTNKYKNLPQHVIAKWHEGQFLLFNFFGPHTYIGNAISVAPLILLT